MTFRSLLTFYENDTDQNAMNAALFYAAEWQAHLDVLHVVRDVSIDTQELGLGISLAGIEAIEETEEESLNAHANKLFESFIRQAASYNVEAMAGNATPDFSTASARWVMYQSHPEAELVRQSHTHDLLILCAEAQKNADYDLRVVIGQGAKPVMLLPKAYTPTPMTHASILWNNSMEATLAMSLSLPLLQNMQAVQVITDEDKLREDQLQQLLEYLRAHGIEASTEHVDDQGSLGEQLYRKAESFGSHVIVMGAFSKKNFAERLMGGVTQHMVEHSNIPLILAH